MPSLGLSVSGTRLSCGTPGAAARLPGSLPGPGHPSAVTGTGEGPAPRCCRSWLALEQKLFHVVVALYEKQMRFDFSHCFCIRLGRKPGSFVSERGLFRNRDGMNYREFRAGFLCLRVVSSIAFLAGAACAAGPGEPLSLW